MAVNHNVNPRPLTAEEKENRTREGLLFCADSGTFARRLLHIAENGKFRFPARMHML